MMVYLRPNEFTVGPLAICAQGSLLLPRTVHELPYLIGASPDGSIALCLSGQHRFHAFVTEGNTGWSGLIVPGVRVEVDPASSPDLYRRGASFGCARRQGKTLSIVGRSDRCGRSATVIVDDELVDSGNEAANFERWQVVLGNGVDRRVLWTVDVNPDENPAV